MSLDSTPHRNDDGSPLDTLSENPYVQEASEQARAIHEVSAIAEDRDSTIANVEEAPPEIVQGAADLFTMLTAGGQGGTTSTTMTEDTDGVRTWLEITSITYSELRSDNHYNNSTIGATIAINTFDGDNPEQKLAQLRGWVRGQFETKERLVNVGEEVYKLERRRDLLSADVDALDAKWNRMREFLIRMGLDPKTVADLFDEVPF